MKNVKLGSVSIEPADLPGGGPPDVIFRTNSKPSCFHSCGSKLQNCEKAGPKTENIVTLASAGVNLPEVYAEHLHGLRLDTEAAIIFGLRNMEDYIRLLYDYITAITAGLAKLKIHTDNALVSNYPLIGAALTPLVLHPAIHLSHFQSDDWEEEGLASRAKIVLEHLYDVYKEVLDEKEPTAATKTVSTAKTTSPSKGIWRRALATASSSTAKKTQTELEVYFSGIYPMADDEDDVLAWWKVTVDLSLIF
ncbi:hypothetical protein B0H13DRAFT_1858925 [Mycena leptocephala]|nr:hypothetical protein B0H13DRAFT_1858925 [Mycena leptocephala]